jgi:endonuclease/exonuclease/phosphatase family metal-dependent hydrolase
MQRFLLPVVLLAAAVTGLLSNLPAGPGTPAAGQDAAGLSLASWNMENFFDKYDDPYRRDEVTKPAYVNDARQKRCAAVLRELNADIVAIQEVENRFMVQEFLDTYLSDMGYELVHLEGNDSRGIDCALLSRVPIRAVTSYQHRRFLGADGMLQHFRRDLLRVSLGAPFDGDVYVVHLKSQFGDEAADIVREAESAEITRILAENAAGRSDYRAVVIGDFNEVPELPTITHLIQGGLVDPMAGTKDYSYNKEPYLTRIDFALMTPALAKGVKNARIVKQLGKHDLEACSDHYPLLVNF